MIKQPFVVGMLRPVRLLSVLGAVPCSLPAAMAMTAPVSGCHAASFCPPARQWVRLKKIGLALGECNRYVG
jgi:hypothetical protein